MNATLLAAKALCGAIIIAVSSMVFLVATADPAHAQRFNPSGQFCFTDDSGRMSVFQGNRRGFTAYPVGRGGKPRFYRRVDRRTYVAENGSMYRFSRNGNRVRWETPRASIRLVRC